MKCWLPCGMKPITSTTFNSSGWRVNIVLTKDEIRNHCHSWPMRVNLLPRSYAIQRFVTFNMTQTIERSYHDWHPINQFLPLTIKVFVCLHEYVDMFLHDYANAIWSLKGLKRLPFFLFFFVLVTFLLQKISTTLQRMQPSSILNQEILISLVTYWLPPFKTHLSSLWLTYYKQPSYFLTTTLQDTPLIAMANLLQAA
jgi:hypothetical protein